MSWRLSPRGINHDCPVIFRERRDFRFRLKSMEAAIPQLGRILGRSGHRVTIANRSLLSHAEPADAYPFGEPNSSMAGRTVIGFG
jgi:hypothetical protein